MSRALDTLLEREVALKIPARRPLRDEAEFPRVSDEFPQPMVIAWLSAECRRHSVIIANSRQAQGTRAVWQPDDYSRKHWRTASRHSTYPPSGQDHGPWSAVTPVHTRASTAITVANQDRAFRLTETKPSRPWRDDLVGAGLCAHEAHRRAPHVEEVPEFVRDDSAHEILVGRRREQRVRAVPGRAFEAYDDIADVGNRDHDRPFGLTHAVRHPAAVDAPVGPCM